jgi:hypothetical protein
MKIFIIVLLIYNCYCYSLAAIKTYDVVVKPNDITLISHRIHKQYAFISLVDANGAIRRKIRIQGKPYSYYKQKSNINIRKKYDVLAKYHIKCKFVKFFQLLNIKFFKVGIGSSFNYGYISKYNIGNICYFLIEFFIK